MGPYDDQKLGFYKVAPFYYYPGWWEGGTELDHFINQKAWDALSAENKAIVEAASAQAHVDMQGQVRRAQSRRPQAAGGAGTKLRAFPQDMMNEAFKAAMASTTS